MPVIFRDISTSRCGCLSTQFVGPEPVFNLEAVTEFALQLLAQEMTTAIMLVRIEGQVFR